MRINFAHLPREFDHRRLIDFAVFGARSTSRSQSSDSEVLVDLTTRLAALATRSTSRLSPTRKTADCGSTEARILSTTFRARVCLNGPTGSTSSRWTLACRLTPSASSVDPVSLRRSAAPMERGSGIGGNGRVLSSDGQ